MSDSFLLNSQPSRSGKFLRLDGQLFLIKGVSYGTFAPATDRGLFPDARQVARDFEAIAELEANTVRTYTVPPVDVLDEASRWGLRLILGVPWMQHVAFLDRRADERDIRRTLRDHVRRLARHPAAMLFALGNEISPSVVRWYGRQRIERFLRDLYEDVKAAAPDALLTYVNYPPTEYLEAPWFDVCAFNLFLHSEEDLSAYLARLHHIAESRPLLISELGADSLRSGEARQAALVRLQLRTVLREGTCGAVVFTWTDDWWRGGRAVDDWAFGLVDAERRPKRAYHDVQRIFRVRRLEESRRLPRVSVVVCAYNAARTIDECLTALETVNYPDFEVIVVNDGSTDGTAAAAARYRFARVINTPQKGLSAARNVGLAHATGEIIAYTDADVRVDPEWLTYLVQPFGDPLIGVAGGPAIVPDDDPWFAQCVARAPGAPTPVLLDDRIAEHVPGCNCAFRTHVLGAIGGFNPLFRRAGDDVDVCWRIQAQGWKIGFAPAALAWHRHRASTRAYWRQQIGYGEGETWLMREHPDKFARGRIDWNGHIYSPLPFVRSLRTRRINTGPFGTAGFPSVYRTDARAVSYLPHSGRWQLAWMVTLAASLGAFLAGSRLAVPLLAAAATALTATAFKCAAHGLRTDVDQLAPIGRRSRSSSRALYRLVIAWLHFVQPFARLWGRVRGLLNRPESAARSTPTTADRAETVPHVREIVGAFRLFLSLPAERSYWSERWVDIAALLRGLADRLRQQRAVRQIEIDSGWWEDRDLTVVPRGWFRLDVRGLVEDHGGGKCLHRFAVHSRLTTAAALPLLVAAAAAGALRYAGVSWFVAMAIVGTGAVLLAARGVLSASRLIFRALDAVATGMGMSVLPSHETARADATRRRPVAVEPAGLTLTNRKIRDETDAARVFVGDG
jgi:glycosyltransferase involved in cell wall biosynthesis